MLARPLQKPRKPGRRQAGAVGAADGGAPDRRDLWFTENLPFWGQERCMNIMSRPAGPRPVRSPPTAPWVAQVFSARAASTGGVVRRSSDWVEREVGREAFVAEVKRRGFHLVETGGQLIVICNRGGLRVIC